MYRMLPYEIWRPVEGYDNYKVSTLGNVVNTKSGKKLKPFKLSGYDAVGLWKKNKRQFWLIHRLVGITFLDWYDGCEFDHISTDKNNNTVYNLRACTHKENCNNPITRKNIREAHNKNGGN